jgi:hypothetical protein
MILTVSTGGMTNEKRLGKDLKSSDGIIEILSCHLP